MVKKLWWMPGELKSSEKEIRTIDDLSKLDRKNDFGSYRYALATNDLMASEVGSHNDLNPRRKVMAIKRALRLSDSSRVLDAGCGLGFTSDAMAACFPDGSIVGVDVSEDAINYATKNFSRPRFLSVAIEPEADAVGNFDCIFCFEFYPFSRTRDSEYQSGLIKWFGGQLGPSGVIVIYQRADIVDSIFSCLNDVRENCEKFDIRVREIPHPKLPFWMPSAIAMLCSRVISLLGREGVKKIIVVKRKD